MNFIELRKFTIHHTTALDSLAEDFIGISARKPIFNTVIHSLNPLNFTISPEIPVELSYLDTNSQLKETNDTVTFTENVVTDLNFSGGGFVGAIIEIENIQPEAGASGMLIETVVFDLVLTLVIVSMP